MSIEPGTRIGPYHITGSLGSGGMGEVYRARDTRLDRDVALKLLPASVAGDPERLARFEREAKTLASLNHPLIASVYGFELLTPSTGGEGIRGLVMELVEGPTLEDRLRAQGSGLHASGTAFTAQGVPMDEALAIARQIAEALEAAHEQGIIHRDLKPANIKVRPDGTVKVLDFGLAKALVAEPDASGAGAAPPNLPTITTPAQMTRAGVILGTAAYMAPEQARGRAVDKRADIWAFGCVLFEMLSGRRPYDGETISDVIARIIEREPDWSALPPSVPAAIRDLLRRCLEKDPKRRLRDIGDGRIALEEAVAHPEASRPAPGGTAAGPAARPAWRTVLPWAVAGLLAAVVAWLALRDAAPPAPSVVEFAITLPPDERLPLIDDPTVAVSPSGDTVAYVARREGKTLLFTRRLGDLSPSPLPGTDGAESPFFSPDGRWIAYSTDDRLKKVALDGSSPVEICACPVSWGRGTWGPDGTIVYTPYYPDGLWKVSASGGTPVKLTEPDYDREELGHWWPSFLPDGKTVLYTAFSTPIAKARIMALSLETGEQTFILQGGTFPRYVSTGHLLFVRDEGLMAVPFSPDRLETTGAPVRVLEDVEPDKQDGFAPLAVAAAGTLAYVPAATLKVENELLWVDREGRTEPIPAPTHRYAHPRLSPDGGRIALTTTDTASFDVWVYDLARNTMTSVASGPTSEFAPLWVRDGKQLLYNLERPQFDVAIRPADGTGSEQLLVTGPFDKGIYALSPNGREVLITENTTETQADILVLPLDGEPVPRPYLRTPAAETGPTFSPDGRWVAYDSSTSGRSEIYVQAYPEPGERWQLSTEGGSNPVWAKNGREVYYRRGPALMAVPVKTEPAFAPGAPTRLFTAEFDFQFPGPNYDVAPDGRFLMLRTPPELFPRTIVVVLNWFEELRRLAPVTP